MNSDAVLIFTPIDYKYKDADTHYAPSLGLVALENYLFSNGKTIDILDGSVVYSQNEILAYITKYKPKFVGQSIQLISYENSLEIAEAVRSYGGINIIGGHHASQMYEAILVNQHHLIDYIIIGDGEEGWLKLLNFDNIESIPNIAYYKDDKVCCTYNKPFDINLMPIDYSRADLKPYQKRLKESVFSDHKYDNYLRIYSHKGCGNRLNSNACVFCGRADQGVRFKSAELYWEDIKQCAMEGLTTYIFDVGDDLLFSEKWIDEVISCKPEISQMYEMGVFGRANRVNRKMAEKLRKLDVVDVVIGFESGDEDVMRRCNKLDSTPAQNILAAEYLAASGIDVTASYVLGLPGDNEASLKNTVKNATKVYEIIYSELGRAPKEMVANLIEPSPGSPAFKEILKRFPEKYYQRDILSLEELQRDYFRCYFSLESEKEYNDFRKMLRKYANEIHSLVDFADSQGWLNEEL